MPTAAEFRNYADQFDRLAVTASGALRPVASGWSPAVVSGGRLASTIERTIDASMVNASGSASQIRSLANECRIRAVRCDAYAAAMREWRAQCASHQAAVMNYQTAASAYASAPTEIQSTMVIPALPGAAPPMPVKSESWIEE